MFYLNEKNLFTQTPNSARGPSDRSTWAILHLFLTAAISNVSKDPRGCLPSANSSSSSELTLPVTRFWTIVKISPLKYV